MAKIRNVVKVMNFHSLLRVDTARKQAEKYFQLEEEVAEMIDSIVNDRNLILDHDVQKPDAAKPPLNIYFGSDYGFCSGYNSAVMEMIRRDTDADRIILGKKMHREQERVLLQCSREAYEKDKGILFSIVEEAVRKRTCSSISIIYNRYHSMTDIRLERLQIYPVDLTGKKQEHTEDYLCEGDPDSLLSGLLSLYLSYEILLCGINTSAAENVLRQNATQESLKRINEREEEYQKLCRKERKAKEFRKIIESYTKQELTGKEKA